MWIPCRRLAPISNQQVRLLRSQSPWLTPALTPEEVSEVHRRVLPLPQSARQKLTKAFREHFQVPRNARSIWDRISQRQHSDFIALFLEEAQGQMQAEAPDESTILNFRHLLEEHQVAEQVLECVNQALAIDG